MHLLLFGEILEGFQDAACTRIRRDRGAIAPGDDSVLIDDEERALRNSLRDPVRAAPRRYPLLGTVPFFFFAPRNPAVVLSLLDLTFSNSFLDSDTTCASLALTRCLISRSSPVSGTSSPPQQRELMISSGAFFAHVLVRAGNPYLVVVCMHWTLIPPVWMV